jgi:hypothetical protein
MSLTANSETNNGTTVTIYSERTTIAASQNLSKCPLMLILKQTVDTTVAIYSERTTVAASQNLSKSKCPLMLIMKQTKNPCHGHLRAGCNRSISHALGKPISILRLPGITYFPLASIILVPPGIIKFRPTCLIIRKKNMQSHV